MDGKPETPFSYRDALTNKVHSILAHSYFFYFVLLLAGVILDLIFHFKIFSHPTFIPVGIAFLVLASLLIFWSQHTTRNLHSNEVLTKEAFCRGPYCYTRTPTNWGLFMLAIGLGIILNAFFVVVTTFASFILSKFVFLKKYDDALEQKYGTPYLEYKKQVKL